MHVAAGRLENISIFREMVVSYKKNLSIKALFEIKTGIFAHYEKIFLLVDYLKSSKLVVKKRFQIFKGLKTLDL